MKHPPSPKLRQAAIDRLQLLIYRSDETLLRITRLLAHAMDAPYGAFSVLGKGDQEYVATHGFEVETMPWADTLCSVSTLSNEVLNISDTLEDDDYADLPVVTQPDGTRFYAGAPVRSPDNWVIGVLCAFGPEPKALSASQVEDLRDYARLVEEALLMRSAAIKDELTGLYNRRYLSQHLDREWRRAIRERLPITFVMFDIDHFKLYNDCKGHAQGDAVLAQVASIFREKFRRAGDTLARIGGEEFVAILPSTASDEAAKRVEGVFAAIRGQRIEHPQAPGGYLTISAGVVTVSHSEQLTKDDPNYFMELADRALYEAKNDGRDCFRVYNYEAKESG